MNSITDFQFLTVNEFVKQVIEGYILSSIEETHSEFQNFYKNIREWLIMSYDNDFEYNNNEKIRQTTEEIFNQILYFRLTGKITGTISLKGYGKSQVIT
ncbi:MAG: hypothetical protein ACTHJ7_07265 [Candidatus Nitrosocosmicus sp.]